MGALEEQLRTTAEASRLPGAWGGCRLGIFRADIAGCQGHVSTHAPMHPPCADMPATVTAEPHAPKNITGGRWAHARGLGGMLPLSSLICALHGSAPRPGLLEQPAGATLPLTATLWMQSCVRLQDKLEGLHCKVPYERNRVPMREKLCQER